MRNYHDTYYKYMNAHRQKVYKSVLAPLKEMPLSNVLLRILLMT
jgi:hypothetical protein